MTNKIDMLLIRACKSANADTRLWSVYRRFYCGDEKQFKRAMISILIGIIERQHLPIRLSDIITGIDPKNWVNVLTNSSYEDTVLTQMINTIRYCAVDRFTDVIWRSKHRRMRNA